MHSMQPVFLGLERAYWQRRGAFARVYYGILSAIRQRVNKPTTAKSLASVVINFTHSITSFLSHGHGRPHEYKGGEREAREGDDV